jgi:alkylated DNA repair dioxygenase AlkB
MSSALEAEVLDGDPTLVAALAGQDMAMLKARYQAQDEFLFLPDFLPKPMREAIQARLPGLEAVVHRNYVPGHKKGGSVSRYRLDERAPEIPALYSDPAFVDWLQRLCGEHLLPCPAEDPHAYALYYYTEPGDHIGYHYDTSYYRGKRYTVLIGVVDDSSSRLEYQLYRDHPKRVTEPEAIALSPGSLVVFNGDKLYHRITSLGKNETRIALTLEYVTDTRMQPWQRFISNMKDAIAYFGFRQVFRGSGGRDRHAARSD